MVKSKPPKSCHEALVVYDDGRPPRQERSRLKSGEIFKSPDNSVRLKVIMPSCDPDYGMVLVTKAPKGHRIAGDHGDGFHVSSRADVGFYVTGVRLLNTHLYERAT